MRGSIPFCFLIFNFLLWICEDDNWQHVFRSQFRINVAIDLGLVIRVIQLELVRVVSKDIGEFIVVVLEDKVVLAN